MKDLHGTPNLVRFDWVYLLKESDLTARVVCPGNRYQYGVVQHVKDGGTVSAPTARWEQAELAMCEAASKDWDIESDDANAAYLNVPSNVEEYGYIPGEIDDHQAAGVDVMVYGKVNAAGAWHDYSDEDMQSGGYIPSVHCSCLYVHKAVSYTHLTLPTKRIV